MVFAISCCILLWLPDSILPGTYILDFRTEYGLIFFGIFCISISFIFVLSFKSFYEKFNSNKKKSKYFSEKILRTSNLDPIEKSVLREFILQNRNVLNLPFQNSTVSGLIKSGIIEIVSNKPNFIGHHFTLPMQINCDIKSLLTESILGFPEGGPDNDNLNYILENRPRFIQDISRDEYLWGKG